VRSKWLDWQRNAQIIEKTAQIEPTKPTKPSSVGFEGSRSTAFSIKHENISEQEAHSPIGVPTTRFSFEPAAAHPPTLPRGLRLVRYEPKQPPICIEGYAVVSDVKEFIEAELRELDARLHNPIQIRSGWGIFTILDWLRQCGVELEIVWPEGVSAPEQPQEDFGKPTDKGDEK
jgi:hypothetical protein